VTELQRRLASARDLAGGVGSQTATQPLGDHSLKEELDELVASECVYCGDLMIRWVVAASYVLMNKLLGNCVYFNCVF
jgi:hypothetical protein